MPSPYETYFQISCLSILLPCYILPMKYELLKTSNFEEAVSKAAEGYEPFSVGNFGGMAVYFLRKPIQAEEKQKRSYTKKGESRGHHPLSPSNK